MIFFLFVVSYAQYFLYKHENDALVLQQETCNIYVPTELGIFDKASKSYNGKTWKTTECIKTENCIVKLFKEDNELLRCSKDTKLFPGYLYMEQNLTNLIFFSTERPATISFLNKDEQVEYMFFWPSCTYFCNGTCISISCNQNELNLNLNTMNLERNVIGQNINYFGSRFISIAICTLFSNSSNNGSFT